jgi:hypothetical protein
MSANIRPELIEPGVAERALPRRHLALAFHDELVEPRPVVGAELSQIECRTGVAQLLAVARRAILLVDLFAG